MPDYPASYPAPDYGSYAGMLDVGLTRTEVPSPRSRQRARFNAPREELSLTFTMNNDQYVDWIAWVKANAYNWFNMSLVSHRDPDNITSVQPLRFISDIAYQKLGDDWLSVTVAVEIQQGVAE